MSDQIKINTEMIRCLKYSLQVNPNPIDLFTGKSDRRKVLEKISKLMKKNKYLRIEKHE